MRALIVDDSNINLKVAQKMLEHENVDTDTATSGKECISKVLNNSYDVVFMDIMMPEMDGVETFNELKKIDGFNIPVVTLTADAVTGAKEKYLNLGFFDYISKPIDINILKKVLDNVKNIH